MTDLRPLPMDVARHCRSITRRRARNFYYGLKLLPEPRRSAMYTVYAWMRKADDIADEPGIAREQRKANLAAFRDATDQALAGNPPGDDPMWAGLAYVVQQFPVDPAHLHAMLDGQRDDLHDREFDTFKALWNYCYNVASTVGLICVEIWGYSDPAARALAVKRGIAFQLTNILRDFREDYDSGRVYLPAEDFERHNIDAASLRRWSPAGPCEALVRSFVDRAEALYEESAPMQAMITQECRPTLWAMTSIYHGLLQKIKADPQQISSQERLRLGAMRKVMIAVQAKWLLPGPSRTPVAPGGARST